MTYLIDSDWVADYLKGREQAIELLRSLVSDGIAISIVTFGEILEGIYYGSDPQRHEQDFQQFLRIVDRFPLNERIFERFAQVRGQLRQTGQLIGDLDLLIGATAVEHELTLVTRNRRHYTRIPNLILYLQQ